MQAKFHTQWPMGLADLLRACERLGITHATEEFVAVADLLGLQVNPVRSKPETKPLEKKPPFQEPPEEQDIAYHDYTLAPSVEEIDFEIESVDAEKPNSHLPAYIKTAAPLPADPATNRCRLSIAPLFPIELSRGILRKHLAVQLFEGEPDIEQMVEEIASGVPLQTIQYRSLLSLRKGVYVMWDTSEAMVAYIEDQRQLVNEIESLFGRENVSVNYFDRTPQSLDINGEHKTLHRGAVLQPGRPIVILSDLGIGRPPLVFNPPPTQDWLYFILMCKRFDVPVVAFLAYDLVRCPQALKKRMRLIHWDRPRLRGGAENGIMPNRLLQDGRIGKLVAYLAHRNPAAVQLALVLSLASKIERSLLREARLRLVPIADAGAEADLMLSELVESYNMDGMGLVPDVQVYLRNELKGIPGLLEKVWSFLVAYRRRQNASHATRIEETLNYLACRAGDPTRTLQKELGPVIQSLLLPEKHTEGLVYWALRVSSQLPDEMRNHPAVQDFMRAAHLRQLTTALSIGQPSENVQEWEPLAAHLLPKISATVKWVKGKLIVTEETGDNKKWIDLPDTQPRVLNVSFPDRNEKEITYSFPSGGRVEIPVDNGPILLRTLDNKVIRLVVKIGLFKRVEAAWAAIPSDIKSFVISVAANAATALFGRRKGGEQKQRFEKAYLAGLKGLTVTLEEDHSGLVTPYLDQPKVLGLLLKILENRSIKDPGPQISELALELGFDAKGDDFEKFAEAVRTFQSCFEYQALEGADPLQWLIYFKIQSYFSEDVIETPAANLEALKKAYLTHLRDDFERITFKGYTKGKAISIPLIEIFTKPLFDIEEDPRKAQALASPEKQGDLKVSAEQIQNHTINTLLQCRLAVVTGGPGAGKSTLLKYLALVLAARQLENKDPDIMPIIFPISAYAEKRRKAAGGTYTIKAFLSDYWQERFLDDPAPLFEAYWQKGRALFLIDGLDGVADEDERLKMISDVRYFIMATMKESQLANRFYITCRSASYEGGSQFEQVKRLEFKRFEIKRFDIEQIGHFLFSWYCWYERDFKNRKETYLKRAQDKRDEMVAVMEGSENIYDLATNPLMLTILALIEHEGGQLPHSRAELYSECLHILSVAWENLRSLRKKEKIEYMLGDRKITDTMVVDFLGPVAFAMQDAAEKEVDESELTKRLTKSFGRRQPDEAMALDQAREFISIMHQRIGLLDLVKPQAFGFLHQIFREYLAARWLADIADYNLELSDRLLKAEWREVVLLMAASFSVKEASRFIEQLVAADSKRFAHLRLAGECVLDMGQDKIFDSTFDDLTAAMWDAANNTTNLNEKATLVELVSRLDKSRADLAPDITNWLHAYLQRLAYQNEYLPLMGLDIMAADATAYPQSQMPLDKVYIQLDTTAKDEQSKNKSEHRLPLQEEEPLTALNALIQHSTIVLLGDPVSGKSTFINHLSLFLARHQLEPQKGWLEHLPQWPQKWSQLIPVPVVLRDLGVWIKERSPGLTKVGLFLAYLQHWLKQLALEELYDTLAQKLKDGQALLLIDGLDEVAVEDERNRIVIEMIDDLIDAFAQTPKLVTCRVLSYQDPRWQLANKKWIRFELAKLSRAKIEAFILAWYRQLSQDGETLGVDDKSTKLNNAVQRSDLLDLARNPLLLTVMAIVHTHRGELPDARARLYEEVIDLLLMHWEKTKVRDRSGREIAFRQLLDAAKLQEIYFKRTLWEIAFDAHGQTQATESENATANIAETTLIKAFKDLHPQNDWNWAAQMISVIKHRAGLLVEDPPEIYSFPHRTFQEYLAGCHLSSMPDFIDQTQRLAGQGAFWWEVILLAVGRLIYNQGDIDRPLMLVDELSPADGPQKEDTAAWRRIWLAGKVLIEIGRDQARRRNIGSTVVERVRRQLTELVRYGLLEPRERADAALVLGALGDPRSGVGVKDGLPDIEWHTISKGPFLMGSDPEQEEDALEVEQPQFECRLIRTDFQIGRYPVSVLQYRCFIDDGGYGQEKFWTAAGWQWRCDGDILGPASYGGVFNAPNHPQVGVSWYEALAFCNWLSDRTGRRISLPTEAQWERAARHTDGRIYPWGREYQAGYCNVREAGIGSTSAVGIFPADATECGAMDFAGNVWEWCCTKWRADFSDYEARVGDALEGDDGRVLRGGSWSNGRDGARCAGRDRCDPYFRGNDIGFRCVRT